MAFFYKGATSSTSSYSSLADERDPIIAFNDKRILCNIDLVKDPIKLDILENPYPFDHGPTLHLHSMEADLDYISRRMLALVMVRANLND